jgi:cell division protein FtsI (penicillin-binding protein 3)
VVQAAVREPVESVPAEGQPNKAEPAQPQAKLPISGTVVLDVEQGGIEVPSFVGKTFRGVVEAAEDSGLELEAVGSGVAREQSPVAGTHVAAGSHVTVQFGR